MLGLIVLTFIIAVPTILVIKLILDVYGALDGTGGKHQVTYDFSVLDELEAAHNKEIELDNAIVFNEIQLERIKELSSIVEYELDHAADNKQKKALLSKAIALDKQAFNTQKQINKLREKKGT